VGPAPPGAQAEAMTTIPSTLIAAAELVSLGFATIGIRATLAALAGQLIFSARTA
jgi:hypothetical protein